MPTITTTAYSAARSFGRTLGIAGRRLSKRAVQVLEGIQNRRVALVLSRFDDRMLADIGVTRADLRDAIATPFWGDPTSLLRARALERRLARRGISHGFAMERTVAPPLAPKVDAVTMKQARVTFSNCG
jgi:uncharacterized protein YjiS (DUF1127 family)